ncbi:DUF2892 domain-containing protein [bacterium]|nr:DUF2892 domain-containing protein [bacterium]
MNLNEALRLIAGAFILISVVIGYAVTPWAYAFTAFVGVNLVQSAFTRWCPMMSLLRACGHKDDGASCAS